MTLSVAVFALVGVLTLTLFLTLVIFLFWHTQKDDRTLLWLAFWLISAALFATCRLLQYSLVGKPIYEIIPKILLTISLALVWFGYELGHAFIGFHPQRLERILLVVLLGIFLSLVWTTNLILTNEVVLRTTLLGEEFHDVAIGPLYILIGVLIMGLGVIPVYRLVQADGLHSQENRLLAVGFLFVILFFVYDFIATFLNLPWIRLSDFSYLPIPILFCYIQVRRFGWLYKNMNDAVNQQTQDLDQRNKDLRIEIKERQQAELELQENKNFLRQIIDLVPHFIFAKDENSRFLLANQAVAEANGTTTDEILGKTDRDFSATAEEAQQFHEDDLEVIKGERAKFIPEERFTDAKGNLRYHQTTKIPFKFGQMKLPALLGVAVDITEQKQAEERIFRQANEMKALYETTHDLVMELDLSKLLHTIIQRAVTMLGATGGTIFLCKTTEKQVRCVVSYSTQNDHTGLILAYGKGVVGRVAETGKPVIVEDYHNWTERTSFEEKEAFKSLLAIPMFWQEQVIGVINILDHTKSHAFTQDHSRVLIPFANQAAIAIKNSNLLESLVQRQQEADAIAEVGRDISTSLQLDIVLERIALHAKNLLHAESSAVYLPEPRGKNLKAIVAFGPDAMEIKQDPLEIGKGILGKIALQEVGEIVNNTMKDPRAITIKGTDEIPDEHLMGVPILSDKHLIGLIAVWRIGEEQAFQPADLDFLIRLAGQVAIAIGNARLFGETQRRLLEVEEIAKVNAALGSTLALEPLLENILQSAILAIPAAKRGSILLADENNNLHIQATWGYSDPRVRGVIFKPNCGYSAVAFNSVSPVIIPDILSDPGIRYEGNIPEVLEGGSAMAVPLIFKNRPIGVLAVDTPSQIDAFTERDLHLLVNLSPSVALAIENSRLFESTQQRLAESQSVYVVSSALRSARNLAEALPIILDKLMELFKAGGSALELVDPASGDSVIEAARGLWIQVIGQRTPAGEGVSGYVITKHQPYFSSDVNADRKTLYPETFKGLNSVACVPIISQQQSIGVLWIGRKTIIKEDEFSLLNAISEMLGNAIHRMQLHEQTEHLLTDLQLANKELSKAYDTTLEGWAKALELRDKETEGHSRRVVDLTNRLASKLGMTEPDLTNLRYGVLLHDIGKMGISDQLLKKPSALTPEEWVEMRMHPKFAYDLIHPIQFLRPALDIPYCHHEKWDGSGYPRGLKGEKIPLGARIFAVVDVYDALIHDRSYRSAWQKKDVLIYLREQSGKHFDPEIVKTFLDLVG